MGWTRIFRTHHTEWLEEQFEKLKAEHALRIAEMKSAHAEELNRVIEDNRKLGRDIERLRLYLTPALQNVELDPDRTPPPSPAQDVYAGTPWQRIQKREIAKQDAEWTARHTKPATTEPAKGESDGSLREGRDAAPLNESSADA
jgi:hypothetical protein